MVPVMRGVSTISMEETVRFGGLADLKLNVRRFALSECFIILAENGVT